MAAPVDPIVYSPEQAAAVTPFTRRTIYEAIRTGTLRAFKPDGVDRWIIYPDDLHEWLRNRSSSQPATATTRTRRARPSARGSLRAVLADSDGRRSA